MMIEKISVSEFSQIYDYLEKRYGSEWHSKYSIKIREFKNGRYEIEIYESSKDLTEEIDIEEIQEILSEEFDEGLKEEILTDEYSQPLIMVNISEDEMLASITIIPGLERTLPSKEEILEALREHGVVKGIDETAIEKALKEEMIFSTIVVAEGSPPKSPINARLDIKFLGKAGVKVQPECEKVKEIINCCDKGVVLAEKIPAVEGKDGYTVTGKVLKADKPKDLNIYDYLGENVELSEDKMKIVSKVAGEPFIDRNGRISIRKVLVIDGDLSKVGNIDFPGTVVINGNAEGFYEIRCLGDLIVRGVAGGVTIKSEGNVTIEKGIFGRSKGGVESKKNLKVGYINSSIVKCEGNLFVDDYIMDSVVLAKGSIIVNGRGIIVGGKVLAGENISCNVVGSLHGTKTIVGCGVNYKKQLKIIEMENKLIELGGQLSTTSNLIIRLKRLLDISKEQDQTEKVNMFSVAIRKLLERKDKLLRQINSLRREIKITNREMKIENLSVKNRIIVYTKCYESSTIQIGENTLNIVEETGPGFFELDQVKKEVIFHGRKNKQLFD